jgi:methylated-DNA-protein-cysteine methyltransferase related protein
VRSTSVMPKSTAFARIKSNVIELIRRVPEGKLTSFAAIATLCDIEARQAAYLLATCADIDHDGEIPWHRALSIDGALQTGKRRAAQASRLHDEGHQIAEGLVASPRWVRLGAAPKTAQAHPAAITRPRRTMSK